MKEYSFVVNDFLPKESQSPDGLLLQMTVDKAEKFLKYFSDGVKGAKISHPDTPDSTLVGLVLCGSLILDSINSLLTSPRA